MFYLYTKKASYLLATFQTYYSPHIKTAGSRIQRFTTVYLLLLLFVFSLSLLAKGSNSRSTSAFLSSVGILFLPLAMISAAKSLLRPAIYFCRFPLIIASMRKSCRVFSMMLTSDTCRLSSVSYGSTSVGK